MSFIRSSGTEPEIERDKGTEKGRCLYLLYRQRSPTDRHRMITSHEKLKRIEDAIDRLSCDRYGICEECGVEIAEKRLQVMPFAAYCLECQDALEERF